MWLYFQFFHFKICTLISNWKAKNNYEIFLLSWPKSSSKMRYILDWNNLLHTVYKSFLKLADEAEDGDAVLWGEWRTRWVHNTVSVWSDQASLLSLYLAPVEVLTVATDPPSSSAPSHLRQCQPVKQPNPSPYLPGFARPRVTNSQSKQPSHCSIPFDVMLRGSSYPWLPSAVKLLLRCLWLTPLTSWAVFLLSDRL